MPKPINNEMPKLDLTFHSSFSASSLRTQSHTLTASYHMSVPPKVSPLVLDFLAHGCYTSPY